MNNYLRRSHVQCSLIPLGVAYLILALIISSVVVGISLIGEPTVEIINGLPFVTDIQGIAHGVADDLTDWSDILGQGFMGFVRLVPVKDCAETEKAVIDLGSYSYGREDQHGSALPASYCPIFSERDLMRKLAPACSSMVLVKIKDVVCGT